MAAKKSSGNFFTNAVKSAVAAVQKAFTPAPSPASQLKPMSASQQKAVIQSSAQRTLGSNASFASSAMSAPRSSAPSASIRNTGSAYSAPSSSYQAPSNDGGFDYGRALEQARNLSTQFTSSFKMPSLVKPVYADDGKSLPSTPTQFKQGVPAIQSSSFLDSLRNLATPRGVISGLGTLSKAGVFGPSGTALAGINDATSGGVGNALAYITPGARNQPKQSYNTGESSYTMGPALNLTSNNNGGYKLAGTQKSLTDEANKAKQRADQVRGEVLGAIDKSSAGYDNFIAQNDELYGLFQDGIDGKSQEISQLIESGATSYEEGLAQMRQYETEQQNALFDAQKKIAEDNIPGYEANFEAGRKRINDLINEDKILGENRKADIGSKYGELVRGITEKKNTSGTNLRNLFSSLGTAESSAAIEQFTNLENEANRQSTDTEQEKIKQQKNIDDQVAGNARNYQEQVATLEREKNANIKAVRDSIELSAAQKSANINAINSKFTQDNATLKADTYNKQVQLKQLEYQALQNRQGLFDQSYVNNLQTRQAQSDQLALAVPTLNDPEAITVRSSGKAVSRPRGVPADMWSTAKQWAETQGVSGSSLSQRLRQQFGNTEPYASWYDTIENLVV